MEETNVEDVESPKITTEYLIGELKDMHFKVREVDLDLLYYAADDLEWMSSKLKALGQHREHDTDSEDCWCCPTIEEHENSKVIIHNRPN